ncbi:helix-turn-helix domain-containing protein [Noviherbaspirillum denitrificans]|uniref:helix-turn-helix domain-containing protein n=1 Tax=Noviherbaspirillum denitrificans TaxID=1968433 RepID=UPI000B53570A|nr:LysR family transcriptional regulator [Noviherbaspirillum denitrificans]
MTLSNTNTDARQATCASTKLDWDDLRYVLAVARTGSLSGAARELAVRHSTMLRRIDAIEEKLQTRLFERLRSGYETTEACNDPAKPAQVRLLKRILQQVSSFPAPGADVECYKSQSSQQ